jgi:nucleoside-diphosphate-sugar epimerase
MRIFVTGASGWVGSAVVQELLGAGHKVLGLARSDSAAAAIKAAGAEVQHGSLDTPDSLRGAVRSCDAVIHTAFNHDFSKFVENCNADARAIEIMGEELKGSERPMLVTGGLALLASGRPATEEDVPSPNANVPRMSEAAAAKVAAQGVRASVVRLPPSVHGLGDHGFVPHLIQLARDKQAAAFIDKGDNHWAGVHRLDAARVFRLAIERGVGGERYHAVEEPSVPFKAIAAVIGHRLGVPVVSRSGEAASEHFGWFAGFAGLEMYATSERTRKLLNWEPKQPPLLDDLDQPGYFGA